MMMKTLLLSILSVVLFSFGAVAQDFYITPIPVNVAGDAGASSIEASSKVVNKTDNTLNLRWEIFVIDMPTTWEVAICDSDQCYPPEVIANDYTLEPREEADMKPTFYPFGNEGTATIEVFVYDPLDSLNTIQINTYLVNAVLTDIEQPEQENFVVYPNPATTQINLPDNKRIKKGILYNIAGKQVRVFDMAATDNRRFDIADIRRGTYLLQFIDYSGVTLHTARLTKR